MWWVPAQRTELDRARELRLEELRDLQAVTDVAEYLCMTTDAVHRLYPHAVRAWGGYLATTRFGNDFTADLRVLEAVIRAAMESVDLSTLDWRP